jgi:release factor glutamine methyltransferase
MAPAAAPGAAMAPHRADICTIAAARRNLASALRTAGIESPELDARILIGHALGLDHAGLIGADSRTLDATQEQAIALVTARRLAREPVARIVGRKEFWSLLLQIDAATLVPRPETETVVAAALAAIDERGPRSAPLRIVDIGTGSGALILALLSELPNAFGIGTDVSRTALAVARRNAHHLNLQRAMFVACNMTDALRRPIDLIVCNPPYIASGDIASLDPEVRDFDPHAALDGGADGLAAYRALAAAVPALLTPGGALVVELGIGQAEPIGALFAAAGLAPSPPCPDLNGMARALVVKQRL